MPMPMSHWAPSILEGDKRMTEATRYYQQAAAMPALDATARLDAEMAQTELAS